MPPQFQGNVPPHDLEVERAVLGAMLTSRENIYKVIEVVGESATSPFYDPRHALIYDAIIALNTRQEPCDMLTVSNELRRRGAVEQVGGAYYITQLTENITSSARVEAHARIVLEKFLLRQLITISHQTITNAYEETDPAENIIDGAERSIFDLAERSLRGTIRPMNELAHNTMEYIEKLSENKRGITGIASGLPALDNVTSGFQNSDLIIVAARPSVGKTSLALSIARHATVKEEMSVGFFSLEMSAQQLVLRLVCADALVNSQALRSGRFSPKQMQEMSMAIGRLAKTKFFIDDTSAISVLELYAKARRMKSQYGIDMIIVDYMQLMHAGGKLESREREVSTISKALKSLAKDLNIPVIALSQLNRSPEARGDKRPILSDLRESGSIEQDADVVIMVHRPDVYQPPEGGGNVVEAELIVAKHRNGPTDTVKVGYHKDYAKFVPMSFSAADIDRAKFMPPVASSQVDF